MLAVLLLLALGLSFSEPVCFTAKKNVSSIDLSAVAKSGLKTYHYENALRSESGAGCANTSNNDIDCCACIEDVLGFIDLDGCAHLYIDWDTLDVTFSLTLNDTVLFESTFGLNTAPELCTTLWGINICVYFEDMKLRNWTFEGCLHLIIDNSLDINLGCWSLSKDTYIN